MKKSTFKKKKKAYPKSHNSRSDHNRERKTKIHILGQEFHPGPNNHSEERRENKHNATVL